MFVLYAAGPGPLGGLDRVNFLYLSTFTRAGGLLAGAAAAFVWRPWRSPPAAPAPRFLDPAGGVALGLLGLHRGGRLADCGLRLPVAAPARLAARARRGDGRRPSGGGRDADGARLAADRGHRPPQLRPVPVDTGRSSCSPGRRTVRSRGSSSRWRSRSCAPSCATASSRHRCGPATLARWWRRAGPARLKALAGAATAVAVLVGCYAAVDPFDRAEGGEEAAFVAPGPPPTAAPAARRLRPRCRAGS